MYACCKSHRKHLLALNIAMLGMFMLTGCVAVGPDYVVPDIPAPPTWAAKSSVGNTTAEPRDSRALATWWATLNDPQLSDLIDRALKNNLDLKKAISSVCEARARRGASAAESTLLSMPLLPHQNRRAVMQQASARSSVPIQRVSMPPGSWTSSAASVAVLRQRRRTLRQAKRT